jgi:hypothetical protein
MLCSLEQFKSTRSATAVEQHDDVPGGFENGESIGRPLIVENGIACAADDVSGRL